MPNFSFQCQKCGGEFDRIMSSVEDADSHPRPNCTFPGCRHSDTERIAIPGCGFQLKGEGWADDGYSKGGK